MSMPVPATLTSYLPVLLVSVTHNAVPDDSSFYTQPEGQVDYLSHNWREEDVWRSWRSMTRQKNAIANGMRLENASWRTWWKQRNGLKTISPETLNWLKDSDVTWLYGPLHIGHDWTDYSQHKTPKLHAGQRKTSIDALPGPYTSHPSPSPAPTKPILKRRSISQLLSLPESPFFHQGDSDDEDDDSPEGDDTRSPARPRLVHTKSDTHISMRGRPFRKNSPPRIIAEEAATSHDAPTHPGLQTATSSEASGSTGSDQDISGSSSHGPDGPAKKKHISFNTFVEQCIAIEKPKLKRTSTGPARGGRMFDAYDDGYDSETGYDGEYDEPESIYYYNDHAVGSDSEDDDDDVLEMRTASSRSRSNSASSIRKPSLSTPLSPESTSPRPKPPMVRRSSTDREHVTIAPIAPTLLKSTGVGNELATLPEGRALESPKDVDLVYVPTASYSHPGTPNIGGNEDVYHHRESYFSVGTGNTYPRSPLPRSPAPGSSPRIPSVGMPFEGASSMRRTNSGTFFPTQHIVDSPMHIDDMPIEDAYDYFGGPDLGEDFSHDGPHIVRRHRRRDARDGHREGEITHCSEGGAASVTTGRSSSWRHSPSPSPTDSPKTPDTDMPVVVVNEVNGAVEERQERSRESSPSRSPAVYRIPEQQASPAYGSSSIPSTPAVPVPRVSPAHAHVTASPIPNSLPSSAPSTGVCADPALLSPSDGMPTRGRIPHIPSVSGSTTTASSSYHSSDSRSGSSSRGRSSTRTSSFSDRERSGSRSRSRGTSSPIGSISPTGSAVGIVHNGSAYASGRCRDRERDARGSRGSRRGGEEERGRERTGRRLGDSLSPPSLVSSPSRGSSDDGRPYQPYSPVLTESILEKPERIPSPPSSVSGSSTETASVSTVGPSPAQQQAQQEQERERPRLALYAPAARPPIPPIPSPIPEVEEEEQRRSRHPTPANSPVAAFRMPVPPAQKAEPVSSPISASHEPSGTSRSPTGAAEASNSAPPESPTKSPTSKHPSRAQRVSFDGMQEQAGTLVNRAAEIVQSARGFLGSIWNSNPVSSS
ncbi:hypothetical protein L227DRAFT_611800 [Lentinus tigrinus ALCF2SS1-6]|uniref:Nitrogen regulatory protein areA GATA-like domain-containing protein n=1 Tax=Lentinus tigrinus ALCF2SS1-6 TaxID=1328759 RepID=A0A5C2S6U2_9APHY|nr:hypothetical protein L227DRAFT_611800 [Lentinus tigrinus ALCF2SS1-6]